MYRCWRAKLWDRIAWLLLLPVVLSDRLSLSAAHAPVRKCCWTAADHQVREQPSLVGLGRRLSPELLVVRFLPGRQDQLLVAMNRGHRCREVRPCANRRCLTRSESSRSGKRLKIVRLRFGAFHTLGGASFSALVGSTICLARWILYWQRILYWFRNLFRNHRN